MKAQKCPTKFQTRQTVLKTIRRLYEHCPTVRKNVRPCFRHVAVFIRFVWALLHLSIMPSSFEAVHREVGTYNDAKHFVPLMENTFVVRRYNISCNRISNSIPHFSSSRQEERDISHSLFTSRKMWCSAWNDRGRCHLVRHSCYWQLQTISITGRQRNHG